MHVDVVPAQNEQEYPVCITKHCVCTISPALTDHCCMDSQKRNAMIITNNYKIEDEGSKPKLIPFITRKAYLITVTNIRHCMKHEIRWKTLLPKRQGGDDSVQHTTETTAETQC